MYDYTIRVSYNPKPGPRADHLLWDAYVEGDEEAGCVHGPTAADALREMADRLEDEALRAAPPKCPACNWHPCLCKHRRSDHGIRNGIDLEADSGRMFLRFGIAHRDKLATSFAAEKALNILSCESLLEQRT